MIHFYTPYNAFSQYLAIEPNPENNHPLQAYKIYQGSGSNKELIHTSYPENFPIPLEEIDFLEELTPHELEESKKRKMK